MAFDECVKCSSSSSSTISFLTLLTNSTLQFRKDWMHSAHLCVQTTKDLVEKYAVWETPLNSRHNNEEV